MLIFNLLSSCIEIESSDYKIFLPFVSDLDSIHRMEDKIANKKEPE